MADYILIGIDGGATEVKAHQVLMEGSEDAPQFRLGDITASRKYERVVGFSPVDVAEQFKQRGSVELTPTEKNQGQNYVSATRDAVCEIAEKAGCKRVLIGMGMPGLKTPNGRGIEVINNGPRIPHFLTDLEQGLTDVGVEPIAPVFRLGSDADYCGIGEEFAADGMFKSVENAYYVGGGTGIADAMKLKGKLVPFDDVKPWMQKAWQISSCLGPTFEKLASALGMTSVFANLLGITQGKLAQEERFPQIEAEKGDVLAEATLEMVALVTAELIFERIHTLANGRQEVISRGNAYLDLTIDHPYRHELFQRVIIGQRIGNIYDTPRFADLFKAKLDRSLAQFIRNSKCTNLIEYYLDGDKLKPGIVVASKLREAPALGAAIDAVRAKNK